MNRPAHATFPTPSLPRHFLTALLLFASLLAAQGLSRAATLPESPRVFIDTTYSAPSGNTITVNAGGNLQAALNNAQLGDTIVLQAGATFTGPFTLPNKTTGAGWIYVRSSALASLPAPGTRVSPTDAANMPKIVVSDQVGATLQTSAGAHHFRFTGIEFKPVAGKFVYTLIDIGGATSVLSNLPTDITFDRCYIHGDPTVGGRRGVAMNGVAVAVVDSYVADFKEVGADTQALWTYNSPGPLKIVNNYLEASGENFMAGGADPAIANLVPSDIEIRRNHFLKPLAWIGSPWLVKNLLEFKNAQRVLVEGNVLENNWPAGQNGFGFLITPRNQDGNAPWSATRDITVRYNKLLNVGQGMNISGRDGNYPSQETQRVLVENNLVVVTRLQNADGRIFQVIAGPLDLTIRHNTALITVAGGTTAFVENVPAAASFDFRDNLLTNGVYGFLGTGTGPGTPTLTAYFSNYTFSKNAFIGPFTGGMGTYPAGTLFPAGPTAVGFVDYAGGNYRLSPASPYKSAATDGKDLGADLDALDAAIACATCAPVASPPPPVADTTPPAISSVGTSVIASTQAVVAWTTGEAADTQVEYGGTTSYGSTTTLASALATSHSQALAGLAPATTYHYRVKSRDAAGNLATSGDFSLTTLAAADTTPPVISAVGASGISSTQAVIAWTTGEAADTQVEYGLTTAYGSVTTLAGALTTSHAQTLAGLAPATTYHYRVKSRDAAGNLATSGDFSLATLASTASGADTTPPSVPSGLALTRVRTGVLSFAWNASSDNVAVAGYVVDVSADRSFRRMVASYGNLDVGTATRLEVSGLARRTTYYARVRAYDRAGNVSANSTAVSAATR